MGNFRNWLGRVWAAFARGLNAVTPARFVLMTIVLALIIVHGVWPESFKVDGTTVGLVLILLLLILVPILRSAEFPGVGKFQFKEELDQAEREAQTFSVSIERKEPEPVQTKEEVGPEERRSDERRWQGMEADLRVITEILNEASRSPRLALIRLSVEIDRAIQELLAASGWGSLESRTPVKAGIAWLVERNQLPPNATQTISIFLDLRNKLVHKGMEVPDTDAEMLRAIDIGVTILRSIQAVPRERHFVYAVQVPLFSDETGERRITLGTGVILESVSPGGATLGHRIFPTTRDHFRVGMQVAWEWNMDVRWPATWYRNPDTNQVESAWDTSVEFVGRDLADAI